MAQKTTAFDDARLLDFVRDQVNTFVKWDLVRFFHDNPYAANTAENIARVAARDPRIVEQDLQGLVASGILEANTVGNARIYRFVKDQEIRALVASFVLACDDREFRVRAINQVIEGLQ
ncbi:MAG TPA: hypothetical protein VHD90_21040 [Phototrophicaceae bacterium]|nr:hypothetical protein [Phototrophicaceae bacterium]